MVLCGETELYRTTNKFEKPNDSATLGYYLALLYLWLLLHNSQYGLHGVKQAHGHDCLLVAGVGRLQHLQEYRYV